jgi:hypothetical protein
MVLLLTPCTSAAPFSCYRAKLKDESSDVGWWRRRVDYRSLDTSPAGPDDEIMFSELVSDGGFVDELWRQLNLVERRDGYD